MKELETKIINIDIEDIKIKLQKMKAEKVKEENQINSIFDFPDRRLLKHKGYARIRVIEDKLTNNTYYYMTTKKMLSQDKFKVMEENEVLIDNAEIGSNIFRALGLELIESISKFRESYKYKNTLIEIDINDKNFCPFPYIEIETEKEEDLREVVELLGYTMEDTTSKTIFEILGDNAKIKGL